MVSAISADNSSAMDCIIASMHENLNISAPVAENTEGENGFRKTKYLISYFLIDNETVDKANKEIGVVDELRCTYHRIWCLA